MLDGQTGDRQRDRLSIGRQKDRKTEQPNSQRQDIVFLKVYRNALFHFTGIFAADIRGYYIFLVLVQYFSRSKSTDVTKGATLCLALAHFAVASLIQANYVSGKVERVAILILTSVSMVDMGANLHVVINSNSHRHLTDIGSLRA